MKKLLVAVVAVVFAAGLVYAAEGAKKELEPVSTIVNDTGEVVKTAVEGTAATLDISKNNPVTTAVETTGKVAEDTVKTVTLQKIDKNTKSK